MAIENFISVQATEGPRLAAELQQHVKSYDVDLMNLQRAEKLVPVKEFIEVQFANGAALKAQSVIISTGARWRQMNVPRSEDHTDELKSLLRTSYAVLCLK